MPRRSAPATRSGRPRGCSRARGAPRFRSRTDICTISVWGLYASQTVSCGRTLFSFISSTPVDSARQCKRPPLESSSAHFTPKARGDPGESATYQSRTSRGGRAPERVTRCNSQVGAALPTETHRPRRAQAIPPPQGLLWRADCRQAGRRGRGGRRMNEARDIDLIDGLPWEC